MGLTTDDFKELVLAEQQKWGPMPNAEEFLTNGTIKTLVESKESTKPISVGTKRPGMSLEDVFRLMKYGQKDPLPKDIHETTANAFGRGGRVEGKPLPEDVHTQLREAMDATSGTTTPLPEGIHYQMLRALGKR